MLRYTFMLILVFFNLSAHTQTSPALSLSTEIKSATVFLKSATVLRKGEIKLSTGQHILKVSGLSPYINAKSIKVKGEGDFTVLAVDHKINYLNKISKSDQLKNLEDQIETLNKSNTRDRSRIDVLHEKKSLLATNKKIGGSEQNLSIDQFRATMEFYEEQLTAINSEELDINYLIQDRNKVKEDLKNQIKAINEKKSLPTGEITIKVEAELSTNALFEISYLVSNAGWYPKYDVRVADIDQPLRIVYKAEVHQNTGVKWDNVKLKFSNGNPNKSGQAPALSTWRLDYSWNTVYNNPLTLDPASIRTVSGIVRDDLGEPLIGATVLVAGTSIGTATDIDGSYELTLPNNGRQLEVSYVGYSSQIIDITSNSMNIKLEEEALLDEVVVTGVAANLQGRVSGVRIRGYSSAGNDNYRKKESKVIPVTIVENTTTVEFSIDKPYSLESGSTSIAVELKAYNIDAVYEYVAVPKLESSAFLLAKLPNWDQYNLLEGEANMYFQDTYIGRTILEARSISDTLQLSLGRDQNILVARSKVDDFSKRRTIGSNQVDSRSFETMIRNKKSKPINITVIDQVPVAANNDISVKIENLSSGQLNPSTGLVTWKIEVPANKQVKRSLEYEVKYPKREDVVLE